MKSSLTVTRDNFCWLFGGFGFHNSEATMSRIMPEDMKEEFVIKTFLEISPTFSRVFGGYANWTKGAMDAFADYYDQTFRKAGTTLYLVPGRLPYMSLSFDAHEYAENVAKRLDYIVKERGCKKVRYYCVTNEMSVGNTYGYFFKKNHLDQFKNLHEELFDAFRRHDLDIGLLAPDSAGSQTMDIIEWTKENMDEVTEAYCWHNYYMVTPSAERICPGDPTVYSHLLEAFSKLVQSAHKMEKRFILGEFGIPNPYIWKSKVMQNDICSGFIDEREGALNALTLAEEEMAALNAGCQSAALWTFMDYPNPFFREDGDTEEEKARYDCSRFSGHGISTRYNKWGIFRWNDDTKDYSARASLYTLGLIARYFRKGSRVLTCNADNDALRCGAVYYSDGGVSICIINNCGEENEITLNCELLQDKPYRCFVYDSNHVPYNKFNDLQPFTVLAENKVTVPAMGMVLLTTEYVDRTPSAICNIRKEGNTLLWDACGDEAHCYYRVFCNGEQIGSTVAEHLTRDTLPEGEYEVISVDKWSNTRIRNK